MCHQNEILITKLIAKLGERDIQNILREADQISNGINISDITKHLFIYKSNINQNYSFILDVVEVIFKELTQKYPGNFLIYNLNAYFLLKFRGHCLLSLEQVRSAKTTKGGLRSKFENLYFLYMIKFSLKKGYKLTQNLTNFKEVDTVKLFQYMKRYNSCMNLIVKCTNDAIY